MGHFINLRDVLGHFLKIWDLRDLQERWEDCDIPDRVTQAVDFDTYNKAKNRHATFVFRLDA